MTAARQFFDGPAGKLAFVTAEPSGPAAGLPVMLVHGINMSSDVWAEMQASLASDRIAVALDLRGHGASDQEGPFGAEDYAADVLALMDHLGIGRAHLVGTSFGGSTVCAAAVAAPARVASIAAIGSALKVEGLDVEGAVGALRAVGVRAFFGGFLPQASFAPGTDQALLDRALASAAEGRDVETVIAVSTTALTADSTSLAEQVSCPALVITGELDATCPVPFGQAMADTLGTELVVLPGRGHVVVMEDPGAVADLVRKHVTPNDEA